MRAFLAIVAPVAARRLRSTIVWDALGLAVIAFGTGMIYRPAGVILAGLGVLVLSWVVSESAPTQPEPPASSYSNAPSTPNAPRDPAREARDSLVPL